MQVSKVRSKEDIRACIDLYCRINDHSFVTINKEYSFYNLLAYAKKQKFLRILLNDSEEIIAWIYADVGNNSHDPEPMMQQIYYASEATGVLAVKCIRILHEAMVDEAKRLGVTTIVSQGSHMDEKFTFARILEKSGWDRRGYIAQLKLPKTTIEKPILKTIFSR